MKKMLLAMTAGLLSLSGMAWADSSVDSMDNGSGTIVRWDAVVGVQVEADSPYQTVGEFRASLNWFWVEGGKVMLNLKTGKFRIQFQHLSWAYNNPSSSHPLGSPYDGDRQGRFVCDALGLNGGPVVVSSEPFSVDDSGSLNYQGVVEISPICIEHPDQMAFLITGPNSTKYVAYGVARSVRPAE